MRAASVLSSVVFSSVVFSSVVFSSVVTLSMVASACSDAEKTAAPETNARFAAVKKSDAQSQKAAKAFCDQSATPGEGGRKMTDPAERLVPGQSGARTVGAWRWVNLWATWCLPCVEEMGLLTKWRDSLRKDGVRIDLELWSVDDDEAALNKYLANNNMPGRVRWLRSSEDLGGFLESLGADKNSAIPVHVLVDAQDMIRCLRVGSVHDEDYGAVKALLTSG
jgi:thiol-disulfide isomerase/thioredoxin